MDTVLSWGGPSASLSKDDIRAALSTTLEHFGAGSRVLAIPPDFSRYHSYAGEITSLVYELVGDRLTDVLPALGTHRPLTPSERETMFTGVPDSLFRVHDWRRDLVKLGEIPREFVREVSEGRLDWAWPAQLNRLVAEGGHDLVLSIGQVVPHEVIGMANHAKNLFIGTGGREGINRSHYLGAVYGMERIMGRADSPVRAVINRAAAEFLSSVPVLYVLTVVGTDENDQLAVRGLFAGRGVECFYRAAELALEVNFTMVEEAPTHVVAWLDPDEFHSTWLGNKAVYRTRMMIADGGRLTVLAPGVETFGEDEKIDRLIRRYGYRGTPATLEAVERDPEMSNDLSAAAHLIHGSSEGRFEIEYATEKLSRDEITSVGFKHVGLSDMLDTYNPDEMKDGWNTMASGERIYYVSRPALGLWAHADRFSKEGAK